MMYEDVDFKTISDRYTQSRLLLFLHIYTESEQIYFQ